MVGKCGKHSGVPGREKKRLRAVGSHILGDGPQPGSITIGIICEAFGCLPSEIETEDWQTIKEILDYRHLISARDQHNQDASKMSPGQIAIWQEMAEAVESE